MRRILLSALTALTMSSCLAHEYDSGGRRHEEYREGQRDDGYRDSQGRAYRKARWHDEDVYQREDGHWYSRRNNDWVMRAEINLE